MTANFRFSLRHVAAAVALALSVAPVTAPAQSSPPADRSAGANASRDSRQQGLSAELMYRLMVGDIALQRGDTALAARAYFEAARDTRDARIARRATEVSLAARQRSLALESARLWSELEPNAERPKQVIAGLSGKGASASDGGGFASDVQAELERALAEAAAAGPRLGEAFMQLNRLLANESDKMATFKLVRTLAQPYPNIPEAHFAVAMAAYNAGLPDPATTAILKQTKLADDDAPLRPSTPVPVPLTPCTPAGPVPPIGTGCGPGPPSPRTPATGPAPITPLPLLLLPETPAIADAVRSGRTAPTRSCIAHPTTALIGVRSSWDTAAMN